MNVFKLKLISPEGVKFEAEVSEVLLPTPQGQIAVLPNHAPVISLLSPGEIIVKSGGKEHPLVTEGGIVEIANNLVKVLADTAEDVESLDALKIEKAKKAAERRKLEAKDDIEYAYAVAAMEKELAKLSILRHRKKRL